jgi:microcystin-dependent protein
VNDVIYANKSTTTSTLTTTQNGAFSYNNTTTDGSAFGLNDSAEGFGEPHGNMQPSAVVNKIIKAKG